MTRRVISSVSTGADPSQVQHDQTNSERENENENEKKNEKDDEGFWERMCVSEFYFFVLLLFLGPVNGIEIVADSNGGGWNKNDEKKPWHVGEGYWNGASDK